MNVNFRKRFSLPIVLIGFVVLLFSLFCLMPFLLVITGSFMEEREIIEEGYKLIPDSLTLEAYILTFSRPDIVLEGYKVTLIVTGTGTIAGLLVNSLMAFPLSMPTFRMRRIISFYSMITLLFNGGMVSWYIICVNMLGLKDSYLALILPYLCNGMYVFLLRNYFSSIPGELIESAKIDGASLNTIFFKIVFPLSKPVLSTVGLFIALVYWNDWWLGIMLVDKSNLKPLQIMLRTILSNVQFIKASENAARLLRNEGLLPSESVKLAVCVLTIGPIVFLYPVVQKYFIRGIMLGAVKG